MTIVSENIEWISQEQSYEIYIRDYKPKRLSMENAVWLETNNKKAWCFLPGSGDEVEVEGLGSFQEWYGILKGRLFIVSLSNDYPGSSYIQIPIDHFEKDDDWSPVKIITALSKDLVSAINWVRSSGTGEYSLFFKQGEDIDCLFCNTSKRNAEELKQYLEKHHSNINMTIALTENFFADWTGYKVNADKVEFLCRYTSRASTYNFIREQQNKFPDAEFKISSSIEPPSDQWRLMRQDDNSNEIEMATFTNHVDAKFAQLEYEKRGHKQIYWVEEKQ